MKKVVIAASIAVLVIVCFVMFGSRGSATARDTGTAQSAKRAAAGQLRIAAAAPSKPTRAIVSAGFGAGPNQLGGRAADESNPEGPMAIVAGNGGLAVLDQVNARIVRYDLDGKPLGTIPIAPDTAQDIAVGPDGRVAVLDRVTDAQLLYYDENGKLIGQTPVVGGPIDESGGTTGVFADSTGVYIEREHGEVAHVLDADGKPDADRRTLPGRPLRDGSGSTQALLVDKAAAITTLRVFSPTADLVWQRTVKFPAPIVSIVMLDSDRAGRVYIAAHLAIEDTAPPFALTNERIVVVRVDEKTGASLGSLTLPPPPGADEALRPLSVGDDGTVYQMLVGDNGVEIQAYTFP